MRCSISFGSLLEPMDFITFCLRLLVFTTTWTLIEPDLLGFLAYKHGAKLTRDTQFYIFSKDFLLEISYSQILSKLGGENRRLIERKECFQEKIVMLFICGISVA